MSSTASCPTLSCIVSILFVWIDNSHPALNSAIKIRKISSGVTQSRSTMKLKAHRKSLELLYDITTCYLGTE